MVLLLFCNLSLKIKDAAESCRGSGSIPCTGNPPVIAIEALAVLHGLQFCLEEGYISIEVESDAANVIVALDKSGNLVWHLINTIIMLTFVQRETISMQVRYYLREE